MGERISRRRILQGVGTIGAFGLIGAHPVGADEREPLDRHIVGVEPGKADVPRRAADEVYRVLDFGDIGQAVSGWYSEEALDGLQNNPNVRYIEAEGEMEAIGQALPWGVDRVDAEVAHANGETGGDDGGDGGDGDDDPAGADIAIIDTGIDSDHPDLEPNLGTGYAVVSARGPYAEEWDDDDGHGTHCAGIADAVDNETGVVGVCTAATLHAVKVLDNSGSGSFSDVAEGIRWVADQGYDVGSMSLGASSGSSTVKDACQYAVDNGVFLVAAAGNSGPCTDCVGYPAAYSTVVAVSSTTDGDLLSDFSSTGPEVELAAPGSNIYSTYAGGGYETLSGTSMACPHVSGAGGQLMDNGKSNTETRTQLKDTAEDIGLGDNEQGAGLLDVAAAFGFNSGDDLGDGNSAPTVDTLSAAEVETDDSDAEFDVSWEVSDADGNLDSVDLTLTDDTDSETEDTVNVSVSGDSASGTTRLVASGDDGSGNGYTVELVVTDSEGASDSDTTTVSETEDDSGEGNAPDIDTFTLTDTSNPRWARLEVDWAVSDADGDLSEVTSVANFANGGTDSETSSVSGDAASGTHELRESYGHGDADVTLTVTDEAGNSTSNTKTINLG